MVFFHIIAAYANDFICGIDNKLPWKCTEDMTHFKNITSHVSKSNQSESDYEMKNAVIMGYHTYQSIGKYLPNRYNFIIDRNGVSYEEFVFDENIMHYHISSLGNALKILHKDYRISLFIQNAFIIGGSKIYTEFFQKYMYDYYIQNMYITKINKKIDICHEDQKKIISYFPFHDAFKKSVKSNNVDQEKHCHNIYNDCWHLHSLRKSPETGNEYRIYHGIDILGYNFISDERNYLQLIYDVLHEGVECNDRTNVGTLSTFGNQIRFSLKNNTLPLLTTKKMFTRGIIEELLWFLRGETDSKTLEAKGVNIWKGNTSRTYLDKMKLNEYAEGEGGPIYGHQFRHFGGRWKIDDTGHRTWIEGGVDQVDEVLYLLREEPNSRRILINLWNPCDIDKMALPPCHMVYQFRVYNGKLSCSMYQRSCDTFLGLPFNICSTALMTYIFAKLTGLVPDEIIISIGDTHIYKNHIDLVKSQLKRTPYCFPKLHLKNRGQKDVEDFKVEDFEILGYESHPTLSGQMAI
jgi:dihydrofolate reductase/thymidylate synthase